jgi:hypothetical protein
MPQARQNDVRPQLIDPDAVGNEDAAAAAGFLVPLPARKLPPTDFSPVPLLPPVSVEKQPEGDLQFGLGVNSDIGLTGSVIPVQACEAPCEPAPHRRELLPVPSLYQLRPSVRRQVMGSLLFGVHPLMAMMPTDKLLDCPSDHPQTAASEPQWIWVPAKGTMPSCPGMRSAERHVYQFTAPDLTQDVLHNLEKVQAAHRLMHLAEHLALSGRGGEALDCFDIVCHLCPGRFDDQVATILLQVSSPVYSSSTEDAEDGAVEELPAPKAGPEEKATDKEAEIERQLNKPVSFNFTDLPLRQVIDNVRACNGLNICIDEAALVQEGISLDRPITIKLTEVSLKTALNLLLRQAHLVYVIRDEVLQITTPACGSGKLLTRIYQVADLVRPTAKGKPARQADMESIVSIITSTIQPQSWAGRGGTGTIDYHALSRALVITQTPDNQEQVADLLAALRRLMEKDLVPHEDAPCSSACPKCEKLHAARTKGTHAQVEGLMKACRLAAEAGRHAKAAELARQAYALDAQRVKADPLVYKMHLLALKRDKGKARRRGPERGAEECEPPCPRSEYAPTPLREPEMPPVDISALEQMLEEAEARPEAAPHHAGVSLHGRYLDVDCSWTGLRMRGQLPLRGSLYYLQFWNGAVSGWVTPNPVGLTPERVDGAIQ